MNIPEDATHISTRKTKFSPYYKVEPKNRYVWKESYISFWCVYQNKWVISHGCELRYLKEIKL